MDIKREARYLEAQLELLNKVFYALAPNKIGYKEITSVIGPMLHFTHETGESMLLLAANDRLRDLIMLSRPFVEGVINICFICAKGDEAVTKAKKHAFQRSYRDFYRDLDLADLKIENTLLQFKDKIDAHRPTNLIDALDEYTTKKGNEVSSWIAETTKEKLEIICDKYGLAVNTFFGFAFFIVYRDVSELLHSSYAGTRIILGTKNIDISDFKSIDEVTEHYIDNQYKLATLILQQMSISTNALIDVLKQTFIEVTALIEIHKSSDALLVQYAAEISEEKKSETPTSKSSFRVHINTGGSEKAR